MVYYVLYIESTEWQHLLFPQLNSQQRNIYHYTDWIKMAGCEQLAFSLQFLKYPVYCLFSKLHLRALRGEELIDGYTQSISV